MTCHVIRPNVRHIGILHLVSILTISPQSAKFYPNRTTPSRKNDIMSIIKMVDLSHLGFLGFNNRFFEKLMYDFL